MKAKPNNPGWPTSEPSQDRRDCENFLKSHRVIEAYRQEAETIACKYSSCGAST